MAGASSADELIAAVSRVGETVARPAAGEVDRAGRFPHEALEGLKACGALGAAVPAELGGGGLGVTDLGRTCSALAQHCASSGMVLAMHHIQVLSIARHLGASNELADYLRRVAGEGRLIASVTSEVGPSGDMRASVCAVQRNGERFELQKQATTVSYGEQADDLLITARRDAQAAPGDQVLVIALRGEHERSRVGTWDALGMRGTCSPGATIDARGQAWQILSVPFGDIAAQTMVPTSHILWANVWYGIAADAVAIAGSMVRGSARKTPGVVPPSARQLSDAVRALQLLRSEIDAASHKYDELCAAGDGVALMRMGFALRINNLKLSVSEAVPELVTQALRICGIMAYKNDSPCSLGRHLRDAHSAPLMINNARLHETNASMLLIHKGGVG